MKATRGRSADGGAPAVRYRYSVARGNNSRLILGALRQRFWWHPCPEGEPFNLCWRPYRRRGEIKKLQMDSKLRQCVNHFEFNDKLCSKQNLFRTVRSYMLSERGQDCPRFLPWTAVLTEGVRDAEHERFIGAFRAANEQRAAQAASGPAVALPDAMGTSSAPEAAEGAATAGLTPRDPFSGHDIAEGEGCAGNVWIVKPGARTKQGQGIRVVSSVAEVEEVMRSAGGADSDDSDDSSEASGRRPAQPRTWVVQKYVERPLLVHKRKFDIRVFVLMVNDPATMRLKGYWYKDWYLRTSCKRYNLSNLGDRFVHLTNDAVQRKSKSFGKFEVANKLTHDEFDQYLAKNGSPGVVYGRILPQMQLIAQHICRAAAPVVNKKQRPFAFELFGFDFLVDQSFRVWLLEVNSNPSLCYDPLEQPFKNDVLPPMIEGVFKLAVDRIFPPPPGVQMAKSATVHRGVRAAHAPELGRRTSATAGAVPQRPARPPASATSAAAAAPPPVRRHPAVKLASARRAGMDIASWGDARNAVPMATTVPASAASAVAPSASTASAAAPEPVLPAEATTAADSAAAGAEAAQEGTGWQLIFDAAEAC